jgi:hypothetical protein
LNSNSFIGTNNRFGLSNESVESFITFSKPFISLSTYAMGDAASIALGPDFGLRLLRQYDVSAILHSHTSCVATLRIVPARGGEPYASWLG